MTAEPRPRVSTLRANDNQFDGSLDHRLLLYALAAGATLACSSTTQAEVLFTPSNAVYQGPARFSIDLDNDGSADFSFALKNCKSFSGYQVVGCMSVAGKQRFDEAAVNWNYSAKALLKSATIGFRHRFTTSAPMGTAFRYIGYWGNVKNRFLGVKFLINGETHFGWIGFRSVIGRDELTATLAGWAYETNPNTAIIAGDEGTSPSRIGSIKPTSLEILATGHTAIDQRRQRATPTGGH